ncbi:hypothetical protein Mapa_004548 [Marchantia paleacea]|nr:hypothetical protein Mapa_004548 [Marchantia paleacea]
MEEPIWVCVLSHGPTSTSHECQREVTLVFKSSMCLNGIRNYESSGTTIILTIKTVNHTVCAVIAKLAIQSWLA